jgi:hypothetical protein
MADDIPQYEFSAAEERLQRASRQQANRDAFAASPAGQARAARRAAAQTAFGAYEAQQARNAAAKTLARQVRPRPPADDEDEGL